MLVGKNSEIMFNCLSHLTKDVFSEVKNAFDAYISCLSQFQDSMLFMENQFKNLNSDLGSSKVSECFKADSEMLKLMTAKLPQALFLVKSKEYIQILQETRKAYNDEYNKFEKQAHDLRKRLIEIVKSLQSTAQSLNKQQDVTRLHPEIVKFYTDFDKEAISAKNILNNFVSLSNNYIIVIFTVVQNSLGPMMTKCSVSYPEINDIASKSIKYLKEKMNEELDIPKAIEKYVLPLIPSVLKTQSGISSPTQTNKTVNYFELENKLSNNAKVKMNCNYTSRTSNQKEIELKAGEQLDLIYAGYSKLWSVKTSNNIICYIPSVYLDVESR